MDKWPTAKCANCGHVQWKHAYIKGAGHFECTQHPRDKNGEVCGCQQFVKIGDRKLTGVEK